jgi:hypothetical protein
MPNSSELYIVTADFLKKIGRPVDFDAVVSGVQAEHPQFSSFEIKDAIWSLLDDHCASLTTERELVFAGN